MGKTKEQFILEGIKKYFKLLKLYADVSITEIKEEKGKDILRMSRLFLLEQIYRAFTIMHKRGYHH